MTKKKMMLLLLLMLMLMLMLMRRMITAMVFMVRFEGWHSM